MVLKITKKMSAIQAERSTHYCWQWLLHTLPVLICLLQILYST